MQLQQLYFVTILRVGYPDDRVLGPVRVYEGGGAVFLLRDEGRTLAGGTVVNPGAGAGDTQFFEAVGGERAVRGVWRQQRRALRRLARPTALTAARLRGCTFWTTATLDPALYSAHTNSTCNRK